MFTSTYISIKESLATRYLTFIRIHSEGSCQLMGLTGIDSDHTSHLGHDIDILDIRRLGLKKNHHFVILFTFLIENTANT